MKKTSKIFLLIFALVLMTAFSAACADDEHTHTYGTPEWTWNGFEATVKFTCTEDSSHTETVTATITNAVTKEALCKDGERTYTATVTFDGQTYTATKTETIPATGVHAYGDDNVCTTCNTAHPCTSLLTFTLINNDTEYEVSIDLYPYPWSMYTNVCIPAIYNGKPVTSIAEQGFYGENGGASITSIIIPSSITNIGYRAFRNCHKLVEIYNLSPHITVTKGSTDNGYLGYYARDIYTSLDAKSNLSIDENGYILYDDGTDRYLMGYMGTDTVLNLPENINGQNYEIYTHFGCYNSTYTSLIIPGSVTNIGESAFEESKGLTSVIIKNGVKTISESAFVQCYNITSITIPSSIISIGDDAFSKCVKLIEIYDLSPNITVSKGSSENGMLGYYALDVHTTAEATSHLNTDSNGYVLYDNGTDRYLVGYMGSETELTLPANINGQSYEINQYAFYYDNKITSVNISEGATSIGSYAFYYCPELTSVTIPSSVTEIGEAAFADSYELTSITFADTSTWYYTSTENHNYTGGTEINVTNTATNATNLTSTYSNYRWYKV